MRTSRTSSSSSSSRSSSTGSSDAPYYGKMGSNWKPADCTPSGSDSASSGVSSFRSRSAPVRSPPRSRTSSEEEYIGRMVEGPLKGNPLVGKYYTALVDVPHLLQPGQAKKLGRVSASHKDLCSISVLEKKKAFDFWTVDQHAKGNAGSRQEWGSLDLIEQEPYKVKAKEDELRWSRDMVTYYAPFEMDAKKQERKLLEQLKMDMIMAKFVRLDKEMRGNESVFHNEKYDDDEEDE